MTRMKSIEEKGFFPLPENSLPYLAGLFHKAEFSGGRIIDACAGEGVALKYLADALNLEPFANELDVERANTVRQIIPEANVTQGDYFSLTTSYRAYNIHFLNPPYQYTYDKSGINNRSETKFLADAWGWPARGQYVVFVSYVHHLTNRDSVELMCAMSKSVDVYRIPEKHLDTYMQTICICLLKDSPNMRKMDMERANQIIEQAEANYALNKKMRDNDYEPTGDEAASLFEDITAVTTPRYDLTPLPPGRESFEFHQAEISDDDLIRLFRDNQPPMNALLPMINEAPDSGEFDVIIKPRFLQLVRLVSGGMFNNVLLDTKRGRVILRSYIEHIKQEVSRVETGEGEEKKTTVKSNLIPKARITLLYEGTGAVENISEHDTLMEFITANRESLMQHIDSHFKPRYRFDFMGGKLRAILKSHTLLKVDKGGTRFRAPLLPPQKHVIAAMFAKLATDKAVILSGKPGTGKTVQAASLMNLMHAASGFGPFAEELSGILEKPMRPNMFNIVVCPGHLVAKHYREILDVNPTAYVGTVASGDGRKPIIDAMNFIRGIAYQPASVLKILIISRDMGKGGETWEPAFWEKNRLEGGELVRRRSDPHSGAVIMRAGADGEVGAPIPIGHLERNPLTNGVNPNARGKLRFVPRGKKKAKYQPKHELVIDAEKRASRYDESDPVRAKGIRREAALKIRNGRRELETVAPSFTPLWQEKRMFSKLKTDPGKLLAARLQSRYVQRMMPLPDLLNPALTPGAADTWNKSQANATRLAEAEYLALPARAPMGGIFRFLAHHFGHLIYLVVADEAHEYANFSAQGTAMLTLSEKATKLVYMTGTLYGGKASSLYCIEFACNPEVRKKYPMDGGGAWQWVKTMGILQETTTTSGKEDAGKSTRRRTQDEDERPSEIPGANPELLLTLVSHMISVELEDMGRALPDLVTVAHDIHMTGEMRDIYDKADSVLTSYLNEQLVEHDDTSFFGMYFQSLLNWPNYPFKPYEVWHRRYVENEDGRKELVADLIHTIPAMPQDFITPKEQALLKIVKKEIAEGRGCAIYVRQSGDSADGNLQARLLDLVQRNVPEANPIILKSTVSLSKREAWLEKHKGNRVLICNAKLVQTGLDLYQYPTLIFQEVQYALGTMDQAGKRARRIGQTQECRNIHLYYMSGGVAQNPIDGDDDQSSTSDIAAEAGFQDGAISEVALEALGHILEDLQAHGEMPEDDDIGRSTPTMESRGYWHMRRKQKAAAYLYGTEEGDDDEQGSTGTLSDAILKSLNREVVVDSAAMFSRASAEEADGDWAIADEVEQEAAVLPQPESGSQSQVEDHRATELNNEQVTITRIVYKPTYRGVSDHWEGFCDDEETTVKVSIWPEDKKLFKTAGYDIKRLFVGRKAKDEERTVACQIDVILKWEQRNGVRVSEVIRNPRAALGTILSDLAVRPEPSKDNGHDLLPAWLAQQLPKLYETEGINDAEKVVHAKLFAPDSGWTWLLTEWSAKERLFFGYSYDASLPSGAEWGYISLDELLDLKGPYGLKVERDVWFKPKSFSEARAAECPSYDAEPKTHWEGYDTEKKMHAFTLDEARIHAGDVSSMLDMTREDWEEYITEHGTYIAVYGETEEQPPLGYIQAEHLIQIVAEARAKRELEQRPRLTMPTVKNKEVSAYPKQWRWDKDHFGNCVQVSKDVYRFNLPDGSCVLWMKDEETGEISRDSVNTEGVVVFTLVYVRTVAA